MTSSVSADFEAIKELQLTLKVRSGEYCAARVGVTLVLYYGKPMHELSAVVGRLYEQYVAVIPENSIRSFFSTTGVWRDFTKDALARRIRRLAAEGVEYSSIHVSSGPPANVGDYGFQFFGSRLRRPDLKPRETCVCMFEFPVDVLADDKRERFVDFAAAAAEVEPFESGHGGYAFKHLSRTWRDQALAWISQRALRFLALDLSYDSFGEAARGRVVNVSWLTLLGGDLVRALGGEPGLRAALSPGIDIRTLRTGLMLKAGDQPPVGDVNRGASDLVLLKQIAAVTRPVRVQTDIGFGSDAFRHGWLNRLD